MSAVDAQSAPEGRWSWVSRAAPAALGTWIAVRALVAISFAVAKMLETRVTLPEGEIRLNEGLLYWDGGFYEALAGNGYAGSSADAVRFFPLYPLLGRWLAALTGGDEGVALLVVANASALIAMFLLWKLTTECGYDRATADRTVIVFGLFPSASILAFGYAEAPFVAFLLLAAIAITRRRPWLAVGPLLALGLLRPTGVLVSLAVAVAALESLSRRRRTEPGALRPTEGWIPWSAAALAPFLGMLTFLLWLDRAGLDGSSPLDYQSDLRAGFREPLTRLVEGLYSLLTGDFRDVYNIAFAIVLVASLIIAVSRRVPWPWTGYLAIGLLVASAANNIDSMGRYGLLLVPAWPIAIALVASTPLRIRLWGTASAIGLVWFTVVTMLGYVVP